MTTLLSVLLAAAVLLAIWQTARVRALARANSRLSEDASRRLEEGSRQASEESRRILTLLEGMSEGVVVVDEDKRILLVNPALTRHLGLREGAKGRFFWEAFRDPDLNEMIEKAVRERRPADREHAVLLTGRTFRIQISPVSGPNGFLGAVAVFHDLTEMKNMQKAQRDFVANVSHELKTPLTSIIGFIETLKEGVDDPKDRARFLDIIDEQAHKLQQLTGDLLVLSRMDAGSEAPSVAAVNVEAICRKLLASFDRALKAKDLEARLEMPAGFMARADARLLEQALCNLIDNAIKYNVEKGRIAISAAKDGQTRIRVEDTGVGIPSEDLEKVFDRFYRVDKSRARETGGSGLGLSIAREIALRHGGSLTAESPAGRGAVFTLSLPN